MAYRIHSLLKDIAPMREKLNLPEFEVVGRHYETPTVNHYSMFVIPCEDEEGYRVGYSEDSAHDHKLLGVVSTHKHAVSLSKAFKRSILPVR